MRVLAFALIALAGCAAGPDALAERTPDAGETDPDVAPPPPTVTLSTGCFVFADAFCVRMDECGQGPIPKHCIDDMIQSCCSERDCVAPVLEDDVCAC